MYGQGPFKGFCNDHFLPTAVLKSLLSFALSPFFFSFHGGVWTQPHRLSTYALVSRKPEAS